MNHVVPEAVVCYILQHKGYPFTSTQVNILTWNQVDPVSHHYPAKFVDLFVNFLQLPRAFQPRMKEFYFRLFDTAINITPLYTELDPVLD